MSITKKIILISIIYAYTANPLSLANSSSESPMTCPNGNKTAYLEISLRDPFGTDRTFHYQHVSAAAIPPSRAQIETAWRYFLLQVLPKFESEFGANAVPTRIQVTGDQEIEPLAGLFCKPHHIYINPAIAHSPQDLASQLGHELVHWYFEKENLQPPLWYEEGIALFFEYFSTRRLKGSAVRKHFHSPWVALGDFQDPQKMLSAYGHAQLLFIYLQRQLNSKSLIRDLLETKLVGTQAIDALVRSTVESPWKNFEETFVDFQIAKRINRIDYMAKDKTLQKRYFIIPTTFKALDREKNLTSQSIAPGKYSSQVINNPLPQDAGDSCYSVTDRLDKKIQVKPCGQSQTGAQSGSFKMRVFQ